MSEEIPRYIGSWKGRVIKAISVDGARKWNEIKESTGLHPKSLNVVLRELFDAGVIEKVNEDEYKVEYNLYKIYKEYFEKIADSEKDPIVKISEEIQNELIQYIDNWKGVKRLNISLKNKHFFLENRFLDDFSKDIIANAKQEVLVVSPWVSRCSLSETLREAVKNKAIVKVIARPSKDDHSYHELLKNEKVLLYQNEKVHAKMTVVDRAVAIISSMNFIVQSSGGQSWEAGLVTIDPEIIQDVVNSILKLIELPETSMNYD